MKSDSAQLAVGDKAPKFHVTAVGGDYGSGREVDLAEFRGEPIVLYFYPKDDTPGCTLQACSLRDSWADLRSRARIFGISVDSTRSHEKFIEKYKLPFPLLSDPEKKIVNAYGVWVEKSMFGKKYMGTERSTFVIDGTGRIAAIFRRVKPEEHVALVLDAMTKLTTS